MGDSIVKVSKVKVSIVRGGKVRGGKVQGGKVRSPFFLKLLLFQIEIACLLRPRGGTPKDFYSKV